MGAGASAAFPEQLNEEQVKIISSSQFQESMFISLQDPDGTVPKDLFVKCFEEGPEREVFRLFMIYCPSGAMPKSSFLTLCRVNKLLNKNTCTSVMAGGAFDQSLLPVKPADGDTQSFRLAETIGFNQFRSRVVPEFAKLKKIEERVLIDKLSMCEFPSSVTMAGSSAKELKAISAKYNANAATGSGSSVAPTSSTTDKPLTKEAPAIDSTATTPPIANTAATTENTPHNTAPEVSTPHPISLNVSVEFINTFTRLQSIARSKIAKRKVANLKEIRDIETGKTRSRRPTIEPVITKRRQSRDVGRVKSLMAEQEALKKEIKKLMGQDGESALTVPDTEVSSFDQEEEKELTPAEVAEQALHDLFDHYCNPPGEMDVNFFKKFMRETYTVTKKFTVNDADTVFKKTIAKATAAPDTTQLRKGVFYGKRINFYVFFHTSIPMTATARGGITKPQLIDFLNNANVAVRSRDTKKSRQVSRRPSRDEPPKPSRRPSQDIAPAHLSSKDNDPNPFARRHPSGEALGKASGIAQRRSFDNGPTSTARKSFDKEKKMLEED